VSRNHLQDPWDRQEKVVLAGLRKKGTERNLSPGGQGGEKILFHRTVLKLSLWGGREVGRDEETWPITNVFTPIPSSGGGITTGP